MTPYFWKKHAFEKPKSKFEGQATYREGTRNGSTPLSPKNKS